MDLNTWNEQIIAEFRADGGRVRWSTADQVAAGRPIPPGLEGFNGPYAPPILLLHNTGAKSGRQRINPMAYLPVGDDFAVFASFGGRPQHPSWFHNLVASPAVTIEVGTETVKATARVLEGVERARVWAAQIAAVPVFASYQAATSREIPVVLLERTP
jgi:deazaflavin-dependent oxidoreductase (nitroreductase family)